MDKKKLGLIFLIIGIAVVLISGFADVLGYGEGNFGPKQGVGVILGLIFIILGWLWWKGGRLMFPGGSKTEENEEVEISNA